MYSLQHPILQWYDAPNFKEELVYVGAKAPASSAFKDDYWSPQTLAGESLNRVDWGTREWARKRSISCACFGFWIKRWNFLSVGVVGIFNDAFCKFHWTAFQQWARFSWNKSCRPWPRSLQIGLTATGIIDIFSVEPDELRCRMLLP